MRSGETNHHRENILMSTRAFIRRQSQLVVWGVGLAVVVLTGFIIFLMGWVDAA